MLNGRIHHAIREAVWEDHISTIPAILGFLTAIAVISLLVAAGMAFGSIQLVMAGSTSALQIINSLSFLTVIVAVGATIGAYIAGFATSKVLKNSTEAGPVLCSRNSMRVWLATVMTVVTMIAASGYWPGLPALPYRSELNLIFTLQVFLGLVVSFSAASAAGHLSACYKPVKNDR